MNAEDRPGTVDVTPHPAMAHLFMAVLFLVFGLNVLLGLAMPGWTSGLCATIAGVLLLAERFGNRVDRR
jgi:hypothetical protein